MAGEKKHMGYFPFFDTRVYRELVLEENKVINSAGDSSVDRLQQIYYPHYTYVSIDDAKASGGTYDSTTGEFNSNKDSSKNATGSGGASQYTNSFSYVSDFYETPSAIEKKIDELKQEDASANAAEIAHLEQQKKDTIALLDKYRFSYIGHRAMVHPYALVKLAGASGNYNTARMNLAYDEFWKRKYYEIDGDSSGGYAKAPTTTTLIKWGNESYRGTQPYAFTDFVFCKWWNKIENNRLITLRRYAEPVTDHIEFPDYVTSESKPGPEDGEWQTKDASGKTHEWTGKNSKAAWVPMATAVTYFGEETGNNLSDLLAFSAKYKWEKIGDNKNPHDITSAQSDAGADFLNNSGGGLLGGLSGGLQKMSKVLGFLGDVAGRGGTNLEGAAASQIPDPYNQGPYENRILGPVNVIMDTYKRQRGLEFTQDGIKIKFEYVARPIAGINNKAVLLDLLANILLLTYSSGTWFGGMWRYRNPKPSMYPFKFQDTMNALYQGKIFGKNGAINRATSAVFSESGEGLASFLPDIGAAIGGLFKAAMSFVTGAINKLTGNDDNSNTDTNKSLSQVFSEFSKSKTGNAVQKHLAAKALKGATIPYITNQRALLSGDPVGDWHLTIGNPLNPIATIGNLICDNVDIKFSDELGPDDFPIGFEAVVSLKHGLGRDRDAIESMFNRGYGRIYALSEEFKTSADYETKVDENTGGADSRGVDGRMKYEETRNKMFTNATAFIARTQKGPLKNRGYIYEGGTASMPSLEPKVYSEDYKEGLTIPRYFVNPWQLANTL